MADIFNLLDSRPLVTAITDASWCPKTKAGGWACWVTSSQQRQQWQGGLDYFCTNSAEAETCAIMLTIRALENWGFMRGDHKLLVQSDCYPALDCFNNRDRDTWNPKSTIQKAAVNDVRYLLDVNTVEFRHVKGHQDSRKGARYYVNNWVDRQAKNEMKKLRKEFQEAIQRQEQWP